MRSESLYYYRMSNSQPTHTRDLISLDYKGAINRHTEHHHSTEMFLLLSSIAKNCD